VVEFTALSRPSSWIWGELNGEGGKPMEGTGTNGRKGREMKGRRDGNGI